MTLTGSLHLVQDDRSVGYGHQILLDMAWVTNRHMIPLHTAQLVDYYQSAVHKFVCQKKNNNVIFCLSVFVRTPPPLTM
jgi:hypothetical protein